MLIAILPLIVMTSGAIDVETTRADAARLAERSPQVRLADALANADSIDSISGRDNTFTFAITRGDEHVAVVATTSHHNVISVVERERDFDEIELANPAERGVRSNLSWLIDTMQETTAVIRLDVDEDGAVTLTTDEGMRYMAIPGRGSGGNAAVEARWAGEWNGDQG